MEKFEAIVYISFFLGMLVICSKMALDMNFERFFKQGKVLSIRAFYVIFVIVTAGLTAWALTNFTAQFIKLIQ